MRIALWILAVVMLALLALQQIDLGQRNRTLREAAALTDRLIADNLALMGALARAKAEAPPCSLAPPESRFESGPRRGSVTSSSWGSAAFHPLRPEPEGGASEHNPKVSGE